MSFNLQSNLQILVVFFHDWVLYVSQAVNKVQMPVGYFHVIVIKMQQI